MAISLLQFWFCADIRKLREKVNALNKPDTPSSKVVYLRGCTGTHFFSSIYLLHEPVSGNQVDLLYA